MLILIALIAFIIMASVVLAIGAGIYSRIKDIDTTTLNARVETIRSKLKTTDVSRVGPLLSQLNDVDFKEISDNVTKVDVDMNSIDTAADKFAPVRDKINKLCGYELLQSLC